MCTNVIFQCVAMGEGFRAVGTGEWFNTRMCSYMFNQITLHGTLVFTMVTLEWLLAGVDAHMDGEMTFKRKHFIADGTDKLLIGHCLHIEQDFCFNTWF